MAFRVTTTRPSASNTFEIRRGGHKIGQVSIDWTNERTLTVFNYNNTAWTLFTTREAAIAWVLAQYDAPSKGFVANGGAR